jgi:hypothetical protein
MHEGSSRPPKFKATVEIELRATDIDAVDDLVHAVWSTGDPMDLADATVYVVDTEPVDD